MNTEPDTAAHRIHLCALSGFVNVLSFGSFSVFICGKDIENGRKKRRVIWAALFLRNTARECVNTGETAYKKQLMCEMYLQTFPDVCLRFHSLCHHYYTKHTAGRMCGTTEEMTRFLLCKFIFLLAYKKFIVHAQKLFCLHTLLSL